MRAPLLRRIVPAVLALALTACAPPAAAPNASGTPSDAKARQAIASGPRPHTVPALREWRPSRGTYRYGTQSRIVRSRAHADALAATSRTFADDLRALTGRAPAQVTGTARTLRPGDIYLDARLPRPRARPGGLRAAGHRPRHRHRTCRRGGLLRHPHAAPAAAPEPAADHPPRHSPGLAPLPRARPDGRRRPQVLHPTVAGRAHQGARLPQAQLSASAPLGQRGLPHRKQLPPRGRVQGPSDQAADQGPHRARGPLQDHRGARVRGPRPYAGGSARTPWLAPGQQDGGGTR